MRTISKAALFLAAAALGYSAEPRRFESVEPHMGTLVRVQIYTGSEARAKAAFEAAFGRIAELDAALSDYKPGSELNRLSREPAGHAVAISADLFRVLRAAQQLSEETGGAFDVTLGPLTHLWREARKKGRVPSPEAIAEAKARTGYRKLRLDSSHRTATLEQPGMQLDVGGIAKGFAADEALAVLSHMGIRSALVAVSGDLAFSGPPPGRRAWIIRTASTVEELANAAVSTSGDDEQHLDAGGRRYSHILDPATGIGLMGSHTISVIARRGIDADALATTATIRGTGGLGCAIISESEIDCSARPSIDLAGSAEPRLRASRSPIRRPGSADRDRPRY